MNVQCRSQNSEARIQNSEVKYFKDQKSLLTDSRQAGMY